MQRVSRGTRTVLMRPLAAPWIAAALGSILLAPLSLAPLILAPLPAHADEVLPFDGEVHPGGLDHEFVDFEVPEGVKEIQIDHDDGDPDDILDWGLNDPSGFRGWGGGNTEPAVVGEDAASRSYLTGPITAGTWRVVIGKAKIVDGSASYHIVVTLRDTPTLAPQPERSPYVASPALASGARWYAGDLHAHSKESGDARPSIEELVTFARSQGLDFVELSDHNTVSQLDFIEGVQANHPDILVMPGVEFTTYAGHANGIGATAWVDHKIGQPGVDIAGAAAAFRSQGALFSINHPALDLGELCIGCAWKHDLAADALDAVEIGTSGAADILAGPTLAFWDSLLDTGRHLPPVGGSDDHQAGQDQGGSFYAPIGTPATYVFAPELSASGIMGGIKSGRTVVKFHGPSDPMVETSSEVSADGDTVHAEKTVFHAKITGANGLTARWVKNGVASESVSVDADPFDLRLAADAPATGQDRYRVEVIRQNTPATVTSHLWLELQKGVTPPTGDAEAHGGGCGITPFFMIDAVGIGCISLLVGALAFTTRSLTRSKEKTK